MKKILVRCWKYEIFNKTSNEFDEVYVTYPESSNGHDLIACQNCGFIYAIDISIEVYVGPKMKTFLEKKKCINCELDLKNNYSSYPETYLVGGKKFKFTRDESIPNDDESLVFDFYDMYSL